MCPNSHVQDLVNKQNIINILSDLLQYLVRLLWVRIRIFPITSIKSRLNVNECKNFSV